MKKLLILFLSGVISLSMFACESNKESKTVDYADVSDNSKNKDNMDINDESSEIIESDSDDESDAMVFIEDFEWKEIEGGIEITSYKGGAKHVVVPEIIDNKKVVSVGTAFSGDIFIEELVLPKYVEKFNLSGCDNLVYLELLTQTLCTTYEELGTPGYELSKNLHTLVCPYISVINITMLLNCPNLKRLEVPAASKIMAYPATRMFNIEELVMPEIITSVFFENVQELCVSKTGTMTENAQEYLLYFFDVDTISVNGVVYSK